MAFLWTVFYWAGIALILWSIIDLIVGLVKKDFNGSRFFTLLLIGLVVVFLARFLG